MSSSQSPNKPVKSTGNWINSIARIGTWFKRATLDLAFPRSCPVCHGRLGDEDEYDLIVCEFCRQKLLAGNDNACPRCADPNHVGAEIALPRLVEKSRIGPIGCLKCHDLPFRFQQALAIGPYENLLRTVAIRMKHANEERLTLAVGHMLGEEINAHNYGEDIDVILPIPIHWMRRYARHYNVSEVLSRGIARETGLVQCDRLLKSLRRTEKQGTLTVNARKENVKGAFGLSSHYELNDANVMLIDDVMTTGSTLSEAAKVCLQGGAATVRVAVAVRATGYG